MRLQYDFFHRSTLLVAEELLGKYLVRRIGRRTLIGKIVETEAYNGPLDLACHASRGRTKRTEVLFGEPGTWYIYLIYGMYYCLNIVTEEKDYPAAVLIRALEPIGEFPENTHTNGPGRLCKALAIDKTLNATSSLLPASRLWIEDHGESVEPDQIARVPRIGVDYSGEYKDKPWRFYITGNRFVSKK